MGGLEGVVLHEVEVFTREERKSAVGEYEKVLERVTYLCVHCETL